MLGSCTPTTTTQLSSLRLTVSQRDLAQPASRNDYRYIFSFLESYSHKQRQIVFKLAATVNYINDPPVEQGIQSLSFSATKLCVYHQFIYIVITFKSEEVNSRHIWFVI